MNVVKIDGIKAQEATSKMFVGQVYRQPLVDEEMAQGIRLTMITFSPGARNLYHTHTSEQVLYVTQGKGIVATENEEFIVTPGMLVYIPPGEKHWHGATKDSSFSHIAIAPPGKTDF